MAGIPDHVTAVTINRVCTSAMDALDFQPYWAGCD